MRYRPWRMEISMPRNRAKLIRMEASGSAFGEKVVQGADIERLGEVRVEARGERTRAIVGAAVTAQREQANSFGARRRPHAPRKLVAVDAGKSQVDERRIERRLERLAQAFDAVPRGLDAMAQGLQHRAQRLACILVVLDDEDAVRLRRSRLR